VLAGGWCLLWVPFVLRFFFFFFFHMTYDLMKLFAAWRVWSQNWAETSQTLLI